MATEVVDMVGAVPGDADDPVSGGVGVDVPVSVGVTSFFSGVEAGIDFIPRLESAESRK